MNNSDRLQIFALIFMVLATLTGCKSSRDESNTNTSNICITTPSACNGQLYQNNQGFTQYPNGGMAYVNGAWVSTGATPFYAGSYLCNCPNGSVPTYNSYSGLGCIQSGFVASGYVSLGWGPQNNQWLNIPQISNNVGYSNQGCYNGVVQSCLLSQPNTCAVGSTCRSTNGNPTMGICTR